MLAEAETWVAVAFVIFVGVLVYFGVHKLLVNALDQRSARIRGELDEARRLKDEAAALLAEYRYVRKDTSELEIKPEVGVTCKKTPGIDRPK